MNREVKYYVSLLKKAKIDIDAIPYELRDDQDIINAEREIGIREIIACGYDVINDNYFAVEKEKGQTGWINLPPKTFEEFDAYYEFLDGKIYNNSCYYQLDENRIPQYVDKTKVYKNSALIKKTIDDFTLYPTEAERKQYSEIEIRKKSIQEWVKRFNSCTTNQQLEEIVFEYINSELSVSVDISFFFWIYIFKGLNDNTIFQAIMKFVSSGSYPERMFSKALCSIYGQDKVLNSFQKKNGANQWSRMRFKEIQHIAEENNNNAYRFSVKKYFDVTTHYFCIETKASHIKDEELSFTYKEYLEDIETFINKLDNDIRGCDLSNVQNVKFSFSNCIKDQQTKLPLESIVNYDHRVTKYYKNGYFYVLQEWKDDRGVLIKRRNQRLRYFFNYVYYLHGDLSNADLLSCDGLSNLLDITDLTFEKARLPSSMCEKFGISYDKVRLNRYQNTTFSFAAKNETISTIKNHSSEIAKYYTLPDSNEERIYYISDIHLDFLIKHRNAKSKEEIVLVLRQVAETINKESGLHKIILIDGDTTFSFELFELFVITLSHYVRAEKKIIFTIGNHEIWSLSDCTYPILVETYRFMLHKYGMYLLQNDVLFIDENDNFQHINEDELLQAHISELRKKVRAIPHKASGRVRDVI